jgi:hypothetical protein
MPTITGAIQHDGALVFVVLHPGGQQLVKRTLLAQELPIGLLVK